MLVGAAGALAMLVDDAKAGVKVVDLCIKGDEFLMAYALHTRSLCATAPLLVSPRHSLIRAGCFIRIRELAKAFNKKNDKGEKVEKGIAFPTCVSLNRCEFFPDRVQLCVCP
jgi:hypothetical protein